MVTMAFVFALATYVGELICVEVFYMAEVRGMAAFSVVVLHLWNSRGILSLHALPNCFQGCHLQPF